MPGKTMATVRTLHRLQQFSKESVAVQTLSRLLPIAALFLVWEVISGWFVPVEILPPVTAVFSAFIDIGTSGGFATHMGHTLFRGLVGVGFAMIIGIPLGLVMAYNDRVYQNIDPAVSLTYPVPKSALIPILLVWLGTGHLTRIVLAVIGSLLPMLVNAYNGATNTSKELLWASKSMGVSGYEALVKVVFPSALPNIMTGIRIGIIFSFVIVISSEMIIAQTGLGVLVNDAGQFGQYDRVFGIILWIAVVVAGIDRLFLKLSERVLWWSEQGVGSV